MCHWTVWSKVTKSMLGFRYPHEPFINTEYKKTSHRTLYEYIVQCTFSFIDNMQLHDLSLNLESKHMWMVCSYIMRGVFQFMRRHLGRSQNCVVAPFMCAMVVRLLATICAHGHATVLQWPKLLEPIAADVVHFRVVLPVSQHLAGVSAHKCTLLAVKVGRLFGELAVPTSAPHRGPELLELIPH